MGIIKEPKGVDFVIQSRPLTVDEQKEISEFIKMRKLQNKNKIAPRNKVISKQKLKLK
ncbi:hypothetical protein LUD75_00335 [Epilithonimonas sp. JDS]|uniref:hypothetical protein n=1 Tax=Epilithonimonas sp. JDS TaxID=2902797 RepID=UPI001E298E31|nr:hypothetical protein [Epilithonimonas sp. JDS]MCD9853135.1 hypothetical protein [Epilithonimonas sp. JDS]